jgi:hypothetical protein
MNHEEEARRHVQLIELLDARRPHVVVVPPESKNARARRLYDEYLRAVQLVNRGECHPAEATAIYKQYQQAR